MSPMQCDRCLKFGIDMEMGHLSFVQPLRGESRYVHLCADCYNVVRDALIGALRMPKETVQTTLDDPAMRWNGGDGI